MLHVGGNNSMGASAMTETFYMPDDQIAKRAGLAKADHASIFAVWEKSGFPPIDDMTGMRYWPAVKAWLDRRHGVGEAGSSVPQRSDGEENWSSRTKRR